MNLENIVLNKCVEVENIPINSLEDLAISYCSGFYESSKGIELPVGYIELRTIKYNFSDYDEYVESLILINYGRRISTIPLKGELKENFDIITKPYEIKILNPQIIFNNSKKSRKVKKNIYYSINKFFSEEKELLVDEDEYREEVIKVLSNIKRVLHHKYRKAVEEYL